MNKLIVLILVIITQSSFVHLLNTNQLTTRVDLCETDKNRCSHICTDANNGINVICSCFSGYELNTNDEISCMDIDECTRFNDICSTHQTCENLAGGYDCIDNAVPETRSDMRTPYDVDDNWMISIAKSEPRGDSDMGHGAQFRGKNIDADSDSAINIVTPRKSAEASSGLPFSMVKNSTRCPTGYKDDSKHSMVCVDIDECLEGNVAELCNEEPYTICQNLYGKFTCIPDPDSNLFKSRYRNKFRISDFGNGYLDRRGYHDRYYAGGDTCAPGLRKKTPHSECLDIDECLIGSHSCDMNNEICENIIGDYKCIPVGGRYDTIRQPLGNYNNQRQQSAYSEYRGNAISDKKYSEQDQSKNKNEDGSCKLGYKLDPRTSECSDIDECLNSVCPNGLLCKNIDGGFNCECAFGYMLVNGICTDIDECNNIELSSQHIHVSGQHIPICKSNEKCVNIPGSYRCDIKPVECRNGLYLNPRKNRCVDIDECSLQIDDCMADQKCVNTYGSFECRCRYGYSLDANRTCVDIDECEIYSNDQTCNGISTCINRIGSYECGCNEGYKMNNNDICEDIDECSEPPKNGSDILCAQKCRNTIGSYVCECNPGFKVDLNDTSQCIDLNECEYDRMINSDTDKSFNKGIKYCQGFCINSIGSYSCTCPPGYNLNSDGKTCDDINECDVQLDDESVNADQEIEAMDNRTISGNSSDIRPCVNEDDICLNTKGGFKCYSIVCPDGYDIDIDHSNRCKKNATLISCAEAAKEECLDIPGVITYYFLTLPSFVPIQNPGRLELFSLKGSKLPSTEIEFKINHVNASFVPGAEDIQLADEDNFFLTSVGVNEKAISVKKSIQGPQDIKIYIDIKTIYQSVLTASNQAVIHLHVSKFNF